MDAALVPWLLELQAADAEASAPLTPGRGGPPSVASGGDIGARRLCTTPLAAAVALLEAVLEDWELRRALQAATLSLALQALGASVSADSPGSLPAVATVATIFSSEGPATEALLGWDELKDHLERLLVIRRPPDQVLRAEMPEVCCSLLPPCSTLLSPQLLNRPACARVLSHGHLGWCTTASAMSFPRPCRTRRMRHSTHRWHACTCAAERAMRCRCLRQTAAAQRGRSRTMHHGCARGWRRSSACMSRCYGRCSSTAPPMSSACRRSAVSRRARVPRSMALSTALCAPTLACYGRCAAPHHCAPSMHACVPLRCHACVHVPHCAAMPRAAPAYAHLAARDLQPQARWPAACMQHCVSATDGVPLLML
jgi:hypothetical protein